MGRTALALAIVFGLGWGLSAEAQTKGKSKSKKKDEAKVLKVGDQVSVFVVGDEAKERTSLQNAGIVNPNYLVLPVFLQPSMDPERADYSTDSKTINRFGEAAFAGDKLGIDQLLAEGRAAKIPVGTKLIVLSRWEPRIYSDTKLPCVPGGDCRARVIEGDAKGKIIEIPVRNLR